jgi:hypothetical protein
LSSAEDRGLFHADSGSSAPQILDLLVSKQLRVAYCYCNDREDVKKAWEDVKRALKLDYDYPIKLVSDGVDHSVTVKKDSPNGTVGKKINHTAYGTAIKNWRQSAALSLVAGLDQYSNNPWIQAYLHQFNLFLKDKVTGETMEKLSQDLIDNTKNEKFHPQVVNACGPNPALGIVACIFGDDLVLEPFNVPDIISKLLPKKYSIK